MSGFKSCPEWGRSLVAGADLSFQAGVEMFILCPFLPGILFLSAKNPTQMAETGQSLQCGETHESTEI